jgi:hypothetical protein
MKGCTIFLRQIKQKIKRKAHVTENPISRHQQIPSLSLQHDEVSPTVSRNDVTVNALDQI